MRGIDYARVYLGMFSCQHEREPDSQIERLDLFRELECVMRRARHMSGPVFISWAQWVIVPGVTKGQIAKELHCVVKTVDRRFARVERLIHEGLEERDIRKTFAGRDTLEVEPARPRVEVFRVEGFEK